MLSSKVASFRFGSKTTSVLQSFTWLTIHFTSVNSSTITNGIFVFSPLFYGNNFFKASVFVLALVHYASSYRIKRPVNSSLSKVMKFSIYFFFLFHIIYTSYTSIIILQPKHRPSLIVLSRLLYLFSGSSGFFRSGKSAFCVPRLLFYSYLLLLPTRVLLFHIMM